MSDDDADLESQRRLLADQFGRELDPLVKYESTFEEVGFDPFDMYVMDSIEGTGLNPETVRRYRWTYNVWREFMKSEGRHPACPSEEHVKRFVHELSTERGNQPATIRKHLNHLNSAYEYWMEDAAFPHPKDYNPIQSAKNKVSFGGNEESREQPRIPIDELRELVDDIGHIRDRTIVALQLKLGLRAGEVCNIKLSDLNLSHSGVTAHYDVIGDDPMIAERENSVFIPSQRAGNKSERPRVMPLDEELRRVLVQYLLIRPDTGAPWLILSKSSHKQLDSETVNRVWKRYFHPKYAGSEAFRPVTSHYGRHRFTTYWMVERNANRELVKYMRGDKAGARPTEGRAGIDYYIHTYYEDIRDLYLEEIFWLNL